MPKRRNRRQKPLLPVLHILCEGEKTEPNYFNGYLKRFHSQNRRLQVVKVEKTDKNTPIQLVEEAIELKNNKNNPTHDVFWVVYDREAESKYSNQSHQRALDQARKNDVHIALSCICFEVWLLLHFSNHTAPYRNFDALLKNSNLNDEVKKRTGLSYNKAGTTLFDLISDSIPAARKRAKSMNQASINSSLKKSNSPHLLNPYSDVYLLLDAIDDFI